MAGHAKKSTKKFEKKHLKDVLERRKDFAKVKQRHQLRDKKRAKRAAEENHDDISNEQQKPKSNRSELADMNVDDFFQGGFEIANVPKTTAKGKSGKRKRDEEDEEEEESIKEPLVVSSDEEEEESDIEEHQQQLNALAEKDPEFYKFLKENDEELLNFDNNDFAEVDELSDEERDVQNKKHIENESEDVENDETEVTKDMVLKWKTSMIEQHSLKAMRQIVLAFRAAAHVNEDDGKAFKYTISDADVYNDVLVTALKHVPTVLAHHLPPKEVAGGKIRIPTESKKFKTLTTLIKSHATSVQLLLANLSDAQTIKMTLSSIEPLLAYILPFRKVLKTLLKTIIDIWSDSSATEATRIVAFILIRRLFVLSDAGVREAILKVLYQSLLKSSRNTSMHTIAHINLLKNSLSEIWGIDTDVGYTTGYTLLRQLAIHLRTAINHPGKDSHQAIYNHQFVHSLDFFSRLLSAHCTVSSPFTPLIYPLVQLSLGTIRLIPTPTFFPLHLTLLRSLLRLSRATNTYVPLAPHLLTMLNSPELRKPGKAATLKPLDLSSELYAPTILRVPSAYLHTRVYADCLGAVVVDVLANFLALNSTSIAFPEFALPILVFLKRWLREAGPHSATPNRNGKVNSQVSMLVQKVEANSKWIESRRVEVKFAPGEREEVGRFEKEVEWRETQLGKWAEARRRSSEEKERLVKEEMEKRQQGEKLGK